MTPSVATARRLALVWGVSPALCRDVRHVDEMTAMALLAAVERGFASSGQIIVIAAGMPFATSGTTNLLRIAQVA